MFNFGPKVVRLILPKGPRIVTLQEVEKVTPPRIAKTDAISSIPGIKNDGPHENVFESKVSVERVYLNTGQELIEYLMFKVHADNGFELKTILPIRNFGEADFNNLTEQISKRKLTTVYHSDSFCVAALEFPIRIQSSKINRELFKGDLKSKEFQIRTFAVQSDDPDIFSGYTHLEARSLESKKIAVVVYLDPKTIRNFGKCGTFQKIPFLPFMNPEFEKAGLPSESYEIIGKNGKPIKVPFNCFSNGIDLHIPLTKPSPEQINDKNLSLEKLLPLTSIPTKLWRRYLETVFRNQYIESIDELNLGAPEGTVPAVRERTPRSSQVEQELGEIYDGPRKSLKVKIEFVLFEVTLTSDKKLFIVDSPLYGRALHAFTVESSAEEFIQNYGHNPKRENEAFVIYHTGDWRGRLAKHIATLNKP